ncbi:MAG: exodeoxyribonuclease III [Pseudomonadota bacterium]
MKIATWNINSVRLRIDHVTRFLKEENPEALCLQETKCRDDQFPVKAFKAAGYDHLAISGQAGYHGVAIAARVPLKNITRKSFCGKDDTRHISAVLPGGIELHNFYVPAGGDEPDPAINEKFDHKLNFLREMRTWFSALGGPRKKRVLVGDLNVAPHENDVWSHKQLLKVVSHTPVEVDLLNALRDEADWTDVARARVGDDQKLYSWWSYRARDWRASNRGRRLDHIWVSPALKKSALAREGASLAIHDQARGWEKPSDHAPVSMTMAL